MDPTLEIGLRLFFAVAVFAAMAAYGRWSPRAGRFRRDGCARWPGNIGIVVVDALLVRLLIPTAVLGAALYAAGHGIGLFHYLQSAAFDRGHRSAS